MIRMLFSTNPEDMSIERMMTSAPGSRPKGNGVYVFDRHKYSAEECDCRLCLHYKRKKCKLPKCGCIEERIEAVAVGYAEFMKHTFDPIKNNVFQNRFTKYINNESEMKFMLFRGNAHKEMFERSIERSLNSDNAMLSAL